MRVSIGSLVKIAGLLIATICVWRLLDGNETHYDQNAKYTVMQDDVLFRGGLPERRKPTKLSLEVLHHETKLSPVDHSLRTTEKGMEHQGDIHSNYNHFKHSYIDKYADMETTVEKKVINDNQTTHLGIRNVPANGEKSVFQKRSKDKSSNRIFNEKLHVPSQKAPNAIPKQVAFPYKQPNIQPKSMVANIDSKLEAFVPNIRASQEPNSIIIDQGQVIFKQIKKVNTLNNSMVLPIGKRNEQRFNVIDANFKESNIIVKQQMKNVDKNESLADRVTVGSEFHQAVKTLHHYCGNDLYKTTKLNFSKKISLLAKVHLLVILNSPLWEIVPVIDALYRPFFDRITYCSRPGNTSELKTLKMVGFDVVHHREVPANLSTTKSGLKEGWLCYGYCSVLTTSAK